MRRVKLDHGERRPTAVLILLVSPASSDLNLTLPPSPSRRAQYSCRTAPDENGVVRRKCERLVRKFRQCPGEPRELVEESREETDETDAKSPGPPAAEFFDRSSTEFFEKTWEGASGSGSTFPGSVFPFPFGSVLGALFGEEPPGGTRGSSGAVGAGGAPDWRMSSGGCSEMTREMEKMEGRDRVREDDAPAGAPAATDDWSRGSKRV